MPPHLRKIPIHPPTWIWSKPSHESALLGNSELHSGGSGAVAATVPHRLGRGRQHARVLLVQHGDLEIRRVGVVEPADDNLGLGH